jgi:pyrroline-5-carboxylate reductase
MKEEKTLGFVGAGNMATALIKGLIQGGSYDKVHLAASDSNEDALNRMRDQFGIKCYSSNLDLLHQSAIVVLSVKPQNIKGVLEEVNEKFRDDHLVISIAAGIPIKMIRDNINRDIPLIRVMPNTPALVQKGISALARGGSAGPEHMAQAIEIFNAVGDTVEVEESMMDAVTALSGSGPGYVFRIMEAMVEAGVSVGLEQKISLRLVLQTFLGAACLAKESSDSLSTLREKVTSPGGTTAAGLGVFDEMGLDDMIKKVVQAARDRSLELGKAISG